MKMVGPTRNTKSARSTASTMLVLDSHWMPFSMPDTAEATNATVSTAITRTSSPVPTDPSQPSSVKPLPIWRAPSPREAAEPKRVAKMARTSMARPGHPFTLFSPSNGVNTALISWRRPRRKVL